MIGNCEIRYVASSNSLAVEMTQNYTPVGAKRIRKHFFEGSMIRTGETSFIWIDQDENRNMQRLIKGILAQNSPEENGDEEIISMNGWCQYNFEKRELVRRIFLERLEKDEQVIEPELYDYKKAPEHLQPYVRRNSKGHINVVTL